MSEQKSRRKKIRNFYSKAREEALSFRGILSRNIIITAITGITIVFMLPFLAETLYSQLWIYAHDNIDIGGLFAVEVFEDYFGLGGGDDSPTIDLGGGVGGLFEAIIGQLVFSIVGSIIVEFRWMETYLRRVIRFVYLSIMMTMIIFLALYLVFSLIMQYKVKFKAVVISWIFGSITAFAIAFFWIPNDTQILEMLVGVFETAQSGDPLRDIPLIVFDILYAFWIGFAILIAINLLLTTALEYTLKEF